MFISCSVTPLGTYHAQNCKKLSKNRASMWSPYTYTSIYSNWINLSKLKKKICKKFLADIWLLFGPLVPLFWISGDVPSGLQSQSGFCLIYFLRRRMYIPWDPPLVLHLPTSWWPVRSRSLPHMHVQRRDLAPNLYHLLADFTKWPLQVTITVIQVNPVNTSSHSILFTIIAMGRKAVERKDCDGNTRRGRYRGFSLGGVLKHLMICWSRVRDSLLPHSNILGQDMNPVNAPQCCPSRG